MVSLHSGPPAIGEGMDSLGSRGTKWSLPRKEIRAGRAVFFPRLSVARVNSIVSAERKRGMRFNSVSATYQECPGVVVWRVA